MTVCLSLLSSPVLPLLVLFNLIGVILPPSTGTSNGFTLLCWEGENGIGLIGQGGKVGEGELYGKGYFRGGGC